MRTVKDVIIYSNNKIEKIRALFDTGTTVNYIKKEIGLKFTTRMRLSESFLVGLGGKKQRIAEQVNLTVQIGEFKMPAQNFFIADIKKFDAIIGAFFMEQWGVVLDPKEKN